MKKPQDELTLEIEEAMRRTAEAVRRRDPDTLAGRVGNAARKTPPMSDKAPETTKEKSRS